MRRILLLSSIIAAFAFTTSSSIIQSEWNEEEKSAFITNCKAGAEQSMSSEMADDYCTCMLDKVMKAYPTPNDALQLSMEQAMEWAQECLSTEEESSSKK